MFLDKGVLVDRLPRYSRKIKLAESIWTSGAAVACVVSFLRLFRRLRTQFWSLTTRLLRARFVSAKRHRPSPLSNVRTTLIVPRSQSMSCQQRAKYSLGRIPVVRASANTSFRAPLGRALAIVALRSY